MWGRTGGNRGWAVPAFVHVLILVWGVDDVFREPLSIESFANAFCVFYIKINIIHKINAFRKPRSALFLRVVFPLRAYIRLSSYLC